MTALCRQECCDHHEQEQAFGVRHREDRRKRIDDQQSRRQCRTPATEVRRPEAHEQRQCRKERYVRDEDRHDPLGPRDRRRQDPDERADRAAERRYWNRRPLRHRPDSRRGRCPGNTSRPSWSGCAGWAHRPRARAAHCAGSAPPRRTRRDEEQEAGRHEDRDEARHRAGGRRRWRSSRSRQPSAGMGTLSDPFILDRLSCGRARSDSLGRHPGTGTKER